MKRIFILSILFISIAAKAQYVEGTIKFNDGHEEKGLVKSFLEEKWFPLSLSSSLEKDLNLDDKYMFFKIDKDAEIRKISIDEIKEVATINKKGEEIIFKVVFLREVNKDGTISDEGRKVYLPILKEGKINIYGFRYSETVWTNIGANTTRDEIFYYQNPKENYAINYGNMDEAMMSMVFGGNMRQKVVDRMGNPLKDLFKDCPKVVDKIDSSLFSMVDEEKEYVEEDKRMRKEFKKLPKEERNNLLTIHAYDFYFIEKLIKEYESCN